MAIKVDYDESGKYLGPMGTVTGSDTDWFVDFEASNDYLAEYVVLFGYRRGDFTSVQVTLRTVDGVTGAPTGTILATSDVIAGSSITTDTDGEEVTFTFAIPYVVTQGVEYAIVCTIVGASAWNGFAWWGNNGAGLRRGYYEDIANPGEWAVTDNMSFWYQVWKSDAPSKPTVPVPTHTGTGITLDHSQLSWTAGANTDTFNIYFGESGSEVLVASGQDVTDENWAIPSGSLDYGTTYGWRVDAVSTVGTTTGDTWTFTTISFDPPVASGKNNMLIIRRLVAAANSKFWYEDV